MMAHLINNKLIAWGATVGMTLAVGGCFPADMSVDYGTSVGPGYLSVGTSFPVGDFGPYYDGPLWGGPTLWPVAQPAPRPINTRPPMRPQPAVPPSPEPGPVITPGGGGGGNINGPGNQAPRPQTGNQFRPGGR